MSTEESEFSYPRPNLIVSREGFSVEVRPRSAILYSEAGKVMDVFAELLVGDAPTIIVRRSDLRCWSVPDEQAAVHETERTRILDNISRALAFKDWTLIVE